MLGWNFRTHPTEGMREKDIIYPLLFDQRGFKNLNVKCLHTSRGNDHSDRLNITYGIELKEYTNVHG